MVRPLIFGASVLAIAAGWVLVLPVGAVTQPIAFNHAKHAAVACATCHSGAETRARATLPSGATCAKCHATPPRSVSQKTWDAVQQPDSARWKPVTHLADYVMFSHRRHVTLGGLACESCHADIGQRTAPPPRTPMRLKMDTCLGCHQREGASADCAACHR
jgi:Cytochrome c7 and related cytochrome c/Class III cytochrome C family